MQLGEQIEALLADNPASIAVAIRHIESGAEVMIDADRTVPLASVVKVPIMVEAFQQVKAGRIRLADRWTLTTPLKTVGSGVLAQLDDGLALSVRDLLELMIVISDNTATDMLLEHLGAANVEATMHRLGLASISVKHTIHAIFDDMLPSGDVGQDRAVLARWGAEVGVRRDGFAFSPGPDNNVGTARDLARLMELIYTAELLDAPSCAQMLEIMLGQQLNERVPRYLPAGTRVANKTGSFAGVRNDAGIIYVDQESHVAYALLSTWNHDAVRADKRAEMDAITALDQLFGRIGLAMYEAF